MAQERNVSPYDLIDQPTHKGGKSHGTHQTKGRVVRPVSRRGWGEDLAFCTGNTRSRALTMGNPHLRQNLG